ncbi:MAG: DegT/DnrJ/EryC1/StrS family aminotransferase [Elusimicrobia bacterium]|nr:DegT/DnrJ/EryC1/StrS family aminotransferase [Elusimicrobiota bacterium]
MSASPLSSPPKKTPAVPILRIPFDAKDRAFLAEGLAKILDSGALVMGENTKAFEREFAALCGVPYAVATSNCTTALEIILRAVGVEGGSVIVPTNTFIATAFAAVHAGAKVVFADSDPTTLCLDPKDVERRLRPDTRAVIIVHIGGIITPAIEDLKRLCDAKGIALVEDCAHAHGSTYKGTAAGAWGWAGAFSFFPTKPLVSGEGGIITTRDQAVYEKALMLRNHGKNPKLGNRITELGHNWRMSEITALLALQQTRKAKELFADRKATAAYYDRELSGLAGAKPLAMPQGMDSTYYKYVMVLEPGLPRDALKKLMKERFQVSLTGEVYDVPCHKEPVWQQHPRAAINASDSFPGADEIAARHFCLPLYPGLTDAERAHVVSSLKAALKEVARA